MQIGFICVQDEKSARSCVEKLNSSDDPVVLLQNINFPMHPTKEDTCHMRHGSSPMPE